MIVNLLGKKINFTPETLTFGLSAICLATQCFRGAAGAALGSMRGMDAFSPISANPTLPPTTPQFATTTLLHGLQSPIPAYANTTATLDDVCLLPPSMPKLALQTQADERSKHRVIARRATQRQLLQLLSSSAPAISSPSSTSTPQAYGNTTIPAYTIYTDSSFTFSDVRDALSCLALDATGTVAVAGSDGGDVYAWLRRNQPAVINPLYDETKTGAYFIDCQTNPAGTLVYLLDTRGMQLQVYNTSNAGASTTTVGQVVATFPDEVVGSLASLIIDFDASIAYVGTRSTNILYSVNVTQTGQAMSAFNAVQLDSDATALALHPSKQTLYYGSPTYAVGSPGTVNALPVSAGTVLGSAVTVVSSLSLIYPMSLVASATPGSNTTLLYIKDGGADRGEGEPGTDPYMFDSLFLATLNGSITQPITMFTSNEVNLPSGMALDPVSGELVFTTSTTLNSMTLVPTAASVSVSSVSAGSSLSSASAVATSTSTATTSASAAVTSATLASSAASSSASSNATLSSSVSPSSSSSSLRVSSSGLSSAASSTPISSSSSSTVSSSATVLSSPAVSSSFSSSPAASSSALSSSPSVTPISSSVSSATASSTIASSSAAAVIASTSMGSSTSSTVSLTSLLSSSTGADPVPSAHGSSSLDGGEIAGIVIGSTLGVVLLCSVCVVAVFAIARRPALRSPEARASGGGPGNATSAVELPAVRNPGPGFQRFDNETETQPAGA